MSWLNQPLKDKNRYWEPEWGLHFLYDSDDPRDKRKAIFGSPDKLLKKEFSKKKLMKKLFGVNRKLYVICNNGSTAVILSIANAAPPSSITLVSFGSYTGSFYYDFRYAFFENFFLLCRRFRL